MRTGPGRDAAEAIGMTVLIAGVGAVAFGIVLALANHDATWLLLAAVGAVAALGALRAVRRLGSRDDPVEASDEIDDAHESVARIEQLTLASERESEVSLELSVTVESAQGRLTRRIRAEIDRTWAQRHVAVGGRMRIWHATFDPDAVDDVLWIETRDLM